MQGSLHAANAEAGGGDQRGCCIEAYAWWVLCNHGVVLHPAVQHRLILQNLDSVSKYINALAALLTQQIPYLARYASFHQWVMPAKQFAVMLIRF